MKWRGKPLWSSRRFEREFDRRWGDLARFNSERSRGVVHSREWVAMMDAKQQRYNETRATGEWALWTCDLW